MRPSYKDFKQKFIPDNYGYHLTLDIDYKYANLWLANINLNKYQSIYLPFKYFDIKLYFVMTKINGYREWKSNQYNETSKMAVYRKFCARKKIY